MLRPVLGRLGPAERELLRLQGGLLLTVQRGLRRLKGLLAGLLPLARSELQRLPAVHALILQLLDHQRLRAVLVGLRALEAELVGLHDLLQRAIGRSLVRLEPLLGLLQSRLLGPVKTSLPGLKLLLAGLQSALLRTVKVRLRRLEVLPGRLQRLLGRNALVRQRDLRGPVQISLRSLELLLCLHDGHLLAAIQRTLARLERLLRLLQGRLLRAVQRSLPLSSRDVRRLPGVHALLLKLGDALLERALGRRLLRLEGLRANSLSGLKLALRQVLSSRERLIAALQGELVLLGRIELAGLVDSLLIGQSALTEGLRILPGDRRDAVDHGRLRGADGHRTVDQTAGIHLLQRHRARALHERAVVGQQALDLPGRSLSLPVDFGGLRRVGGRLLDDPGRRRRRSRRLHIKGVVRHRGRHGGPQKQKARKREPCRSLRTQ